MIRPIQKVPLVCSQRLTLAVLAFFGTCLGYVARVNLSMAILCMVRSDAPLNVTTLVVNASRLVPIATNDDGCGEDVSGGSATSDSNNEGEFDWDKSTSSRLLSMYFYGYIFTQIPGGWLSGKLGGSRVWGFCMFVSAICSLLTPVAVRTDIRIAYALRFILGFAAGVTFPCVHALLGRWAPPYERSKLASYTFGGALFGLVITFSISGFMCAHGFDNGWGSIFYLSGIFNMIWVVAWFLLTADTPEQHKRISTDERDYIRQAIGKGIVNEKRPVPWLKMFTSGPVWAIIIAHVCNNYTAYTLLTSLPMFMKESLKFDIKQNGVLSSLPYVTNLIGSITSGYMADMINEKGWLTTKNQRKLFMTICFLGAGACLCVTVQLDCSRRYVAVALLCVCTVFISLNKGGYLVNHLDLAPSYAGILFGITNTAATIPGIIAPVIAGALTPNRTSEEWRTVFYLCAGVCVAGAIVYIILADGELQEWSEAKDIVVSVVNQSEEIVLDDDNNDDTTKDDNIIIVESNGAEDPLVDSGGSTDDMKSKV